MPISISSRVFPPRRILDGLSELDVSARERPAPGALVQRPPQKPDPPVLVARNRRRDGLLAEDRAVAAAVAVQ
jgi:hypothetical protein